MSRNRYQWEPDTVPMTIGMMQLDRAIRGQDTFLQERRERKEQERIEKSQADWENPYDL